MTRPSEPPIILSSWLGCEIKGFSIDQSERLDFWTEYVFKVGEKNLNKKFWTRVLGKNYSVTGPFPSETEPVALEVRTTVILFCFASFFIFSSSNFKRLRMFPFNIFPKRRNLKHQQRLLRQLLQPHQQHHRQQRRQQQRRVQQLQPLPQLSLRKNQAAKHRILSWAQNETDIFLTTQFWALVRSFISRAWRHNRPSRVS